jgi:hypothetical protein
MAERDATGRDPAEEYLWDPGAAPDAEVARLERALARYRHVPRPLELPRPSRPRRIALALAASIAVLIAAWAWLAANGGGYAVEGLAGVEVARAGDRIETGADAGARMTIARIGDVVVAPRTRLRVDDTGERAHKLYLERGRVRARIDARPGLFQIGTPAGLSIDMGCVYDLAVGDDARSTLVVETGRVAFEEDGRRVLVPAGATCESTPGTGPNVPVRVEAALDFVADVRAIEAARDPDAAAVERVLAADIRDESVTLWHLFTNAASPELRRALLERLLATYPLPDGVGRERIAAGDAAAIDAWREIVARDWR